MENIGFAVWLTGLPSSGKSSISRELKRLLAEQGISVQILDSDELRKRLTPQPTYSAEERKWFYAMIHFLTELLTENGVNVLIAATGARREFRDSVRARVKQFAEIHVDCPKEVCRARDPKGLWQMVEKGEIRSLPGAGAPYEAPISPEMRIDSSIMTIEEAGRSIFEGLHKKGFLEPSNKD